MHNLRFHRLCENEIYLLESAIFAFVHVYLYEYFSLVRSFSHSLFNRRGKSKKITTPEGCPSKINGREHPMGFHIGFIPLPPVETGGYAQVILTGSLTGILTPTSADS